ncbi:hypothetical protein PAXRUDRAFT_17790 [Paxillus rubicundulus Ve08.2h10]|uniref:Unplaced genomic scaffold scaffold_2366, whole genome shotgun sequence n=1 Tax=Paxillus rubicundulus Ve08.2h10 TaxID=930991 RepID=A0A0D0C1B4_9AGAM|nr:hypothetical protein PAXRUDRAFT_17790 [Paxillus rubicundulus Ve08.2h10]
MLLMFEHSSQETYEKTRLAIQKCHPGSEVPSFYHTKTALADITGIKAMIHHMCLNSCLAYVRPYADYETCLNCGEFRFDQIKLRQLRGRVKVPRAVFNTIPLALQLQALFRTLATAQKMKYREQRTQEIYKELLRNQGLVDAYDNVLTGSVYLDAVRNGKIGLDNMLLIFLIDGAQLYESKLSDCWIYIWIVLKHTPDERYKKKHVLPGAIIPGPNKPKYIESFLYLGFHHVSAVQREGLMIWDASIDQTFTSNLFLILACADGPGLLCLSNLYYPVLLQPDNYQVNGCLHPDISHYDITPSTSSDYVKKLKILMAAPNQAQYEK